MEISQSALACLYLYALLLGVGLGAIYDALRITRVFLGVHYSRKAAKRLEQIRLPFLGTCGRRHESRLLGVIVFVEDLLFCILAGVAVILLLYEMNNGKIRLPVFFCAAAGFLIWRATLGRAVMLFSEAIAFGIEVAIRYICFFVLLPLRTAGKWIAAKIRRTVGRVRDAHRKKIRLGYTAAELRRASQNACGMIPDDIPRKRTLKGRGRLVSRKSKKKTVQPDLAFAHSDRRSGGGFNRRVRKQSDEI